jgi:hypothetical protein
MIILAILNYASLVYYNYANAPLGCWTSFRIQKQNHHKIEIQLLKKNDQ